MMILRNILFRPHVLRMRRANGGVEPEPYADNAVDLYLAALDYDAGHAPWFWPKDRQAALVLSHDTDTGGQQKGLQLLTDLARRLEIKSTMSFVGRDMEDYGSLIEEMRADGFEIALHDVLHDNTISFQSAEVIVDRLRRAEEHMRRYEIEGFRSPSWYVSPILWQALPSAGFKYDMSALDTWPFFDKARRHGVKTFFPYAVGELVILPNTIPFDDLPGACGYGWKDVLAFWKPKIDLICRNGGLVMFNAHPDKWLSGNKQGITALQACMEYALDTYNIEPMRAVDVADHFRLMSRNGATRAIDDNPKLEIPNQASRIAFSELGMPNPCRLDPRTFRKSTA